MATDSSPDDSRVRAVWAAARAGRAVARAVVHRLLFGILFGLSSSLSGLSAHATVLFTFLLCNFLLSCTIVGNLALAARPSFSFFMTSRPFSHSLLALPA